MPTFAIETPPSRALGDLAVTVAFQLARTLRKAPRAIAQELAPAPRRTGGRRADRRRAERIPQSVPRTAVVCPASIGLPRRSGRFEPPPRKTIVEHTAINPNKAAHVGHLRNAALGDTLVRVLRFRGTPVEVQNYIDDTGVQVADVIVGFRELEHRDARGGARRSPTRRDSTTTAGTCTRRSPNGTTATRSRLEIRARALHDLEHGGNETADMGAFIVDRIVRAHLKTMARLNIGYDLLTYEGDILRLKFWAHALRHPEVAGCGLSADRRPAGWLLGDADRGG